MVARQRPIPGLIERMRDELMAPVSVHVDKRDLPKPLRPENGPNAKHRHETGGSSPAKNSAS